MFPHFSYSDYPNAGCTADESVYALHFPHCLSSENEFYDSPLCGEKNGVHVHSDMKNRKTHTEGKRGEPNVYLSEFATKASFQLQRRLNPENIECDIGRTRTSDLPG